MNSTVLATAAVAAFGTSMGLLAQSNVPPLDHVPWASLASSSGMIVAMGIALRYVTLRQTATEEAVNKSNVAHTESIKLLYTTHTESIKLLYEKHVEQLTKLLQQEKDEGKQDRELLRATLESLAQVINKLAK